MTNDNAPHNSNDALRVVHGAAGMPLSKEQRRVTCVHEAGHAVVHALGGIHVHRVAVAPEGVASWEPTLRRGGTLRDAIGVCEVEDMWFHAPFLFWEEGEGYFRADRKRFESFYRRTGVLHAMRRELRARVCGTLAGPITEMLVLGEGVWVEAASGRDRGDDIQAATGLSLLLPWRNEFEHLADLTEGILRDPTIWASVMNLADALEFAGAMPLPTRYLPERIKNWPPSPREKRVQILSSVA